MTDKHYYIQSDEAEIFLAGRTSLDEQVLIGVAPEDFVIAIFFSQGGTFLRQEYREVLLPQMEGQSDKEYRIARNNLLWKEYEDWKSEIRFSSERICVDKFFVVDWKIGIADLPEFMQSIVNNPTQETNAEMEEAIRIFQEEEQYILWWCGKEFWMNKEGEITDT